MNENTGSRPTATTEPGPATEPSWSVRAKDHASMAVVLSGAAIAWFGWGHQGGQHEWWLRAGMILSALALVGALWVVHRIPVRPTLATDPRARRVYWTAVIAEVLCIVGGAVVLGMTGHGTYLSTWTLFVVGVHFLPFVGPFDAPILRYTAVACVFVAGAALWAGLVRWAPAPTIAGAGGGIVLLGFALVLMTGAARTRTAITPGEGETPA